MNEREPMNLTPAEEKAKALVRGLGEVRPSEEFRRRLGREFVTGSFSRPPLEAPAFSPWKTAVKWMYVPAAAAALLVVVLLLNRGPAWQVAGVSSRGTVSVSGLTVSLSDAKELARVLRPGARIRLSDDAELTLRNRDYMVFQAGAGSEMVLPNRPGRWFGRRFETEILAGEVMFLTGPEFPGRDLLVSTPEGRTEVTGTVFSVVRDPSAKLTCVCVTRGRVRIGMNAEDMESVAKGYRKVMFSDGREPMVVDIMPEHRSHLVAFEGRVGPILESDRPR